MSFTRIRKIGNHSYLYEETRWREGKRVRSRSKCLGRVAGAITQAFTPVAPEQQGLRYIERLIEKYPGDPYAAKAAEAPTPIEKPATNVNLAAPATTPSEKGAPPGNDAEAAQSGEAASQAEGQAKC